MRKNLLALFLILAVSALLFRPSRSPNHEIYWEGHFELANYQGYGRMWLDMENDRYRVCETGCTQAAVTERGTVTKTENRLELVSEDGRRRSYTLSEVNGETFLRDSNGKSYPQLDPEVPRIHPRSSWLKDGAAFEVDGVALGMSPTEVRTVLPKVFADEFGQLICRPYRGSNRKVTIQIDRSKGVASVEGSRLSQDGRPLLNEWSSRGDIENLFPGIEWQPVNELSFGTRAEATYQGLHFSVSGLTGAKLEEHRLYEIKLSR